MITVRIDKTVLASLGADIHAGLHTLERLRAAGVPVIGNLLITGVREGVLRMHDDALLGEIVWTWEGEESLS